MSRATIVAASILFFAVALVVEIGRSFIEPAPLGAVVASAIAVYAVSAVIPLVIWAFGRFRSQKAIIPVAVWGVLLVLVSGASVAKANFAPLLTALLENPDVKKGFREGFISSARKSCITSARSQAPSLSDAQIESYCGCTAAEMADKFTPAEMVDLARYNELPPEIRGKIVAIAAKCRVAARGR